MVGDGAKGGVARVDVEAEVEEEAASKAAAGRVRGSTRLSQ